MVSRRAGLLVSLAVGATTCERAPRPEPTKLELSRDTSQVGRLGCLDTVEATDARYHGVVRALCADLHNLQGIGASVAIAEQGKLAVEVGVGQACADGNAAVTPDTVFRIGSITKTLTAATALSVARRGQLSLSGPITEYVPAFELADPATARGITLRHLLAHTSGLPEIGAADTASLEPDRWFAAWADRAPWSAPGQLWRYSNSGYGLAAAAIEGAAGRPYVEVVRARVLEPLQLSTVTFDAHAAKKDSAAACGHPGRKDHDTVLDIERDLDWNAVPDWAAPAGGAMASAPDLVRLGLALLDGDAVLDAAGRRAMMTPQIPTHLAPGEFYAMGLIGRPLGDGLTLYRHSGNTGDFAADLYLVPERGFALAIVSNTGAHYRATAEAAFEQLLGASLAPPTATEPPRPTSAYAGDYTVAGWDDPIRIALAGDRLRLNSATMKVEGLELRRGRGDTFQLTWPALGTTERVTFVFDDPEGGAWIRGQAFVGRRPAPSQKR